MKLTLHVGAPKCGSSALQAALSAHPTLHRPDGTVVNYATVKRNGEFLVGAPVTRDVGLFGYASSAAAQYLVGIDLPAFGKKLQRQPTDIVLSSEAWLARSELWTDILEATQLEVEVVVYVRPQVPLFNSAWWQTGAWGGNSFETWMNRRIATGHWTTIIEPWTKMRRVKRVHVRPVAGDVTRDFVLNVLGATPPFADAVRTNRSLPTTVLRLFQRNLQLKPKKGRSRIDFVLSSELQSDEPTAWIIDQAHAARIIDAMRADNERLLSLMDETSAAAVRNDPAWWDPAAYASRAAQSPDPQPLDPAKLEALCVDLAEALVRVRRREAKLARRSRYGRGGGGDEGDDPADD